MGLELEYVLVKRGFYPFGGGKIIVKVPAYKELKPLVLNSRGKIKQIKIYSVCTDADHIHFHKNLAAKVKSAYPSLFATEEIDFVDKTYQKGKRAKHRATYIVVESENGSVQKVETFWNPKTEYNGGIETERIMKELAEIMEDENVAIDEYHSDQLLIFMALAKGESVMTVKELSLHFQTMCHLIPMFFKDVQITITQKTGLTPRQNYNEIRVKGIGYQPAA